MLGRNGGRGSRFLSALAAANDTDPASDVSIYEQARLLFMLEEYKQIKQENLVSIGSMQQTLSFGLTGISLLIAALTQIYRQDKIVTLVILAAVGPGLLVLIERAWSAEVMRLGRASYFLSLLEPQVNAYFRSRKVPDIQAKEKILSFLRKRSIGKHGFGERTGTARAGSCGGIIFSFSASCSVSASRRPWSQ